SKSSLYAAYFGQLNFAASSIATFESSILFSLFLPTSQYGLNCTVAPEVEGGVKWIPQALSTFVLSEFHDWIEYYVEEKAGNFSWLWNHKELLGAQPEQELFENKIFLDAVMETAVMKYCHQYCLVKNASYNGSPVPESESGFKRVLNSVWFELYSRSGGGRRSKLDSSGFEHVFVGEVKNGQISGFHNWIQFYLEEKAGNVDYRGYIKTRSHESTAETNNNDPVLTLQFSWNGVEKFVGTSFIGVSPEFELVLYTMTFLMGKDENAVTLDTGGVI
ncbi:hypothetical protein ACHAWX_000997, partial [Stephanocyclus meneghinianus]